MTLNEQLDPIRSSLPLDLDVKHVTFEMLARVDGPTEEEKAAIVVLVEQRRTCNERLDDAYGEPARSVLRFEQRATVGLADLYSGQTTFGEFNRALQEIWASFDNESADESYREQMLAAEYGRMNAAQEQARAARDQARATREQTDAQERARLDERYRAEAERFRKAFAPKPATPSVTCTTRSSGYSSTTTCD